MRNQFNRSPQPELLGTRRNLQAASPLEVLEKFHDSLNSRQTSSTIDQDMIKGSHLVNESINHRIG